MTWTKEEMKRFNELLKKSNKKNYKPDPKPTKKTKGAKKV